MKFHVAIIVFVSIFTSVLAEESTKNCAGTPAAFWVSSPAQKNETVMICGGNFTPDAEVILTTDVGTEAEKEQIIKPSRVTETAVFFELPTSMPAQVAVRCGSAGTSQALNLNVPEVWWIQGDQGRCATVGSGGWISVQTNTPTIHNRLTLIKTDSRTDGKADGKTEPILEVSAEAETPISLASVTEPGTYTVLVNGRDAGTIELVSPQTFYRPERFDITDFGAKANDRIDDTLAFRAALEAIRKNGGGILYVPRGRFQMRETIELPPHSALMGPKNSLDMAFSMDPLFTDCQWWPSMYTPEAEIYWPDTSEPLDALVHGTHDFVVQNIFLTCGNHRNGISNKLADDADQTTPQKNVLIERVMLRMLYSEFINSTPDEMIRRHQPIHYVRALRLSGENITVRQNDIYCAAGGVFELKCYWSCISENRFCRGNIVGWNGFRGQQILFTRNFLGGANCTSFYGLPEGSENILWRGNLHENNFDGNNRETITGDLHIHGYFDRVESITPTGFTLKKEVRNERNTATLVGLNVLERGIATWYRPENELQRNGLVQIASGKGVGQFRRIREITTQNDTIHVTVERPWDILPDEESVLAIASFRRHFLYVGNAAYDSTCALQFYGSQLESLIQGNVTSRTGGFNGDSMFGEPSWYNQFIENRIAYGNTYRSPRNGSPASDAHIGILAYGNGIKNYRYPLIRGCVVRRNSLNCNTFLNVTGPVTDTILERNNIHNSDCGIFVDSQASGILLRRNSFDNVTRPYNVARDSVILDPAEKQYAALQRLGVHTNFVGDIQERDTRLELLQKLARQSEDGVIEKFPTGESLMPEDVELLTGLKIKFPNWKTVENILMAGEAGTAPLYIQAHNSEVYATLKMWIDPADFAVEGWSFVFPELQLQPSLEVAKNMFITKPAGRAQLLVLPIRMELVGEGWKLRFRVDASNPWAQLELNRWEVSAPMQNPVPTTQPAGIGYAPYSQMVATLTDTLRKTLQPCVMERGMLVLNPEKDGVPSTIQNGDVVYARTTLTTRKAVRVRLSHWSQGALVFVNGKIVGTNQANGQWGFLDLQEGENALEVWIYARSRDKFRYQLPRITWVSEPFALVED